MKIGGFQPCTLIDYPGLVAAVVFTAGCDFRCAFCHNPALVQPPFSEASVDTEGILDYLHKRKGIIDALVLSGGEPCLQPDLAGFCARVKELGYAIKLDTNGNHPQVLESLIQQGLVDYVAMDIKGPLNRYSEIAGVCVDTAAILKSIALIEHSGCGYVFRTTVAAPILSLEDIPAIAALIRDRSSLILQPCRPEHVLDAEKISSSQYTEAQLAGF